MAFSSSISSRPAKVLTAPELAWRLPTPRRSSRLMGVVFGSWYWAKGKAHKVLHCSGSFPSTARRVDAPSIGKRTHLGQEEHEMVQVFVVDPGLPAEVVFQRDCVRF